MSRSFSLMFSSRNFTVLGLTFRSLVHFEIISVWSSFIFLHAGLIFPNTFVDETNHSSLCVLDTFLKDQLTVFVCIYFCVHFALLVYMFGFVLASYFFDCFIFVICFEMRNVMPPALFCLKTVLFIWSPLWFHINFSFFFSISVKIKCHWDFDRNCFKSIRLP